MYGFSRGIEAEFFALAQAQDMAITAWSPLAGGLLTGKFNPGAEQAAEEVIYWKEQLKKR